MATFDAAAIVEPLNWTFAAFVPGAEGCITEPDDKQIARFWADLRKLTADTARHAEELSRAHADARTDGGDEHQDRTAADEDDVEAAVELHRRTAEIYSALCSGSPSEKEILSLPMRIRIPFYTWLRKEVMDPEAVAGGGKAQVANLRSVAAG